MARSNRKLRRSNRRVHRTNRRVHRSNRRVHRTNRKVRRSNRRVHRTNRKVHRINSHRKIKGGSDLTRQMTARTADFVMHRQAEREGNELKLRFHREKVDKFGEGPIVHREITNFPVGMSDTIGHRRTMEDCMAISGNYRGQADEDFLAVFDGHGGMNVSELAGEHAPAVIEAAIAGRAGQINDISFTEAFQNLNTMIEGILGNQAYEQGSTGVIAIRKGDRLHLANVGESRAVLGRAGVAERLTNDHKPTEAGEKERIEAEGGAVIAGRLNADLAVSRSFGDLRHAPALSVEPEVFEFDLVNTDHVLILACDGLWDVMTDQQAIDKVMYLCSRGCTAKNAADALRDEALKLGSRDNISVMVSIINPILQNTSEIVCYFSNTEEGKLGIIFGDNWPRIKSISEGSLGQQRPIDVGMSLISVNGEMVVPTKDFDHFGPIVKRARRYGTPLELIFNNGQGGIDESVEMAPAVDLSVEVTD